MWDKIPDDIDLLNTVWSQIHLNILPKETLDLLKDDYSIKAQDKTSTLLKRSFESIIEPCVRDRCIGNESYTKIIVAS